MCTFHAALFCLFLTNWISAVTNLLAPINRDKYVNEVILCKMTQKITSNLLIPADREQHGKLRSFARMAFNIDLASMPLDDVV